MSYSLKRKKIFKSKNKHLNILRLYFYHSLRLNIQLNGLYSYEINLNIWKSSRHSLKIIKLNTIVYIIFKMWWIILYRIDVYFISYADINVLIAIFKCIKYL